MKSSNLTYAALIIFLSLFSIYSNGCSNTNGENPAPIEGSEPQQQVEPSEDGFKQIEFGFNIGFLSYLQQYRDLYVSPLARVKEDGFTHMRVYDPFTKGMVPFETKVVDHVKYLTDQDMEVLFCISNYPYPVDKTRKPEHQKGDKPQYTNRYKPANLEDYKSKLDVILKKFEQNGMMNQIEFEIGNEPESRKFHWGDAEEFVEIAEATEAALQPYNRPIFCCGFTGNFARKELPAYPDYKNFVEKNSIFNRSTEISFHIYQEGADRSTPRMKDIQDTLFYGGYITEYNLSASMPPKATQKHDLVNSPLFVSKFAELLDLTYRNDIGRVYLFKLVDIPGKGRLGFFDENGAPKESYIQFLEIYDVVKDGYKIERTANQIKIIGKQSTIHVALNDLSQSIDSKKVTKSSDESFDGKLKKEEWVRYNNK